MTPSQHAADEQQPASDNTHTHQANQVNAAIINGSSLGASASVSSEGQPLEDPAWNSSSALPPAISVRTPHSSLRVVTDLSQLNGSLGRPGTGTSPASLFAPSPSSQLSGLKVTTGLDLRAGGDQSLASDAPSAGSPLTSKELQFDPRFLAETWSQESPQSVYALLAQPMAQLHGFTPLAISPSNTRLLSPMAQSQQALFGSHFQGFGAQISPMSNRLPQLYASPLSLPPSPHPLHGSQTSPLSPLFPSASPSGGPMSDLMGLVDGTGAFAPQTSPTAMLRHLLPPIVPRPAAANAKDLTLNELRPHFNKPMAVVAKELGVCITLMKKICRRNGLVRWPHRRIRSLVNRITSLQVIAANASGAEKKRFASQISALREELSSVIQNPNEKSRKAQADAKARHVPATEVRPGSLVESGSKNSSDDGDQLNEEESSDEEDIGEDADCHEEKKKKKIIQEMNSSESSLQNTFTMDTKRRLDNEATQSVPESKRKAGFRAVVEPPPPIKIPRLDLNQSIKMEDDEEGMCERPSSTTSTGSGKRGSILSILCEDSL